MTDTATPNPVALDRLNSGDRLDAPLLVRDAAMLKTAKGEPYLRLTLMNATGQVTAFLWNNQQNRAVMAESVAVPGRVVAIKGKVNTYQGQLQLVLDAVDEIDPATVDATAFFRPPVHPAAEVRQRLEALIGGGLQNPALRALLRELFFADPAFFPAFVRAPAGKVLHHAYPGGLADHAIAVATLAEAVAPLYPDADRDLLVVGAWVHDLGKVHEMAGSVLCEYTTAGRLLGHLVLGIVAIGQAAARIPGFPPVLLLKVQHLVAAHHGELAHGSPVVPQTLEALLLHRIDDLDARAQAAADTVRELRQRGEDWSPRHRLLATSLFAGDDLGDGQKSAPVAER